MSGHEAGDRPTGAELLGLGASELKALLPHIPKQHQLTARLIMKAMKIAGAELTLDVPGLPDGLAKAIRSGARDEDAALPEDLRAWVEARLAITNPRYLERARALRHRGSHHDD